MKGVLVVERIVLESISGGFHSLEGIQKDTGLDPRIVRNVLVGLEKRSIVNNNFEMGRYSINKIKMNEWDCTINHKDNVKEEIKDIFVSLVNRYFEKGERPKDMVLKFQKIAMTDSEERVFKCLMKSLESFIGEVKKKQGFRAKRLCLKDYRMIFWGISDYRETVKETL